MRVVFLGTAGPLSTLPLQALLAAGIVPAAVIAARTPGERRLRPALEPLPPAPAVGLPVLSRSLTPSVVSIAWEHGIPAYEVGRLSHAASVEALRDMLPEVLCAACFPEILSPAVLAAARFGGLNVHPSPLPKLRGPHPLFWSFLEGQDQGGVTVHRMVAQADAGPILAQRRFPMSDGWSLAELEQHCGRIGGELLAGALNALADGSARPLPQIESDATYRGHPGPEDYRIHADRPARWAYNFIRGVAGPARPVEIVIERDTLVVTGADSYHEDRELPVASRREGGLLAIRFRPGIVWVPAG